MLVVHCITSSFTFFSYCYTTWKKHYWYEFSGAFDHVPIYSLNLILINVQWIPFRSFFGVFFLNYRTPPIVWVKNNSSIAFKSIYGILCFLCDFNLPNSVFPFGFCDETHKVDFFLIGKWIKHVSIYWDSWEDNLNKLWFTLKWQFWVSHIIVQFAMNHNFPFTIIVYITTCIFQIK